MNPWRRPQRQQRRTVRVLNFGVRRDFAIWDWVAIRG